MNATLVELRVEVALRGVDGLLWHVRAGSGEEAEDGEDGKKAHGDFLSSNEHVGSAHGDGQGDVMRSTTGIGNRAGRQIIFE